MNRHRYLILALALLSTSMSGPLVRLVVAAPAAVVFWRLALATPLLAILALWRGDRWPWKAAVPAGFFFALHLLSWVVAIQTTTIASAAVLICTGALWSAFLSKPLLKEPTTPRLWVGIALGLLGVGLIVTAQSTGHHTLRGDLFALAGAFFWVGYTFIGRKARQNSTFLGYGSALYLTCAAVAFIPAAATRQLLPQTGASWLAIVALAIFPTLLGHGNMNYLLRYLGPTRLSLWTLTEPAVSSLAAVFMFGEIPAPQVIIGGLITLVGVAVGASEKDPAAAEVPAPAP